MELFYVVGGGLFSFIVICGVTTWITFKILKYLAKKEIKRRANAGSKRNSN